MILGRNVPHVSVPNIPFSTNGFKAIGEKALLEKACLEVKHAVRENKCEIIILHKNYCNIVLILLPALDF